MKNNEGKLKIICTILLSVFFVISGVFIAGKYVFSSAEDVETNNEQDVSGIESGEATDIEETIADRNIKLTISDNYDADISKINIGTIAETAKSENGNIMPSENDYRVIPDKYNTGCAGELTKATSTFNVGGLEAGVSGGNLVFDFYHRNKNASGTYIIENYDFSDYGIAFNSENKVSGKKITIIFNNCKFSKINTTMRPASDVFTHVYNNCTIEKFGGSNSIFNKCKFGNSFYDCIVPFSNVEVNDCYFSNLASNDPKGNGIHSDGTQMYGYSDSMVQNVKFSNCRFEIPAVKTTQSTAAVNACIMLGLEYNNGSNIRIEDCILNGGGYTIYAGKKYEELSLSEVYFTNVKIGAAKLFGNIYPSFDENVVFTDVVDQDSLYVSSVWNDGSKTHVIVSNDTAEERILRVVTGKGSQDFTIGACLGGRTLRYDVVDVPFEEFPFDIDISVDADADYVICFDVTDGNEKQIRYVSFDGNPTYYSIEGSSYLSPNEEEPEILGDIVIEGDCGENITYKLTSDGRLIIKGTGVMYNYHSQKTAPWYSYSADIVSIKLSEGITQIGTQAFRNLKKVQSIKLPKTLTKINSNAFSGCSGLKNLTMYSDVSFIGQRAFAGTKLAECTYYGNEAAWNKITIEANNDILLSCKKIYKGK